SSPRRANHATWSKRSRDRHLAGVLGFQPGLPASARRCLDAGLTLQNQGFKRICDNAAPRRLVVALCSHRPCCCQFVANLLGTSEQIGRQSSSTSKPLAAVAFCRGFERVADYFAVRFVRFCAALPTVIAIGR